MNFESEPLPVEKARILENEQRLNQRLVIQMALMTRDPQGEYEWGVKYAETFGDLYDHNQEFHDLVMGAQHKKDPQILTQIQERLDQERASHTGH